MTKIAIYKIFGKQLYTTLPHNLTKELEMIFIKNYAPNLLLVKKGS